MCMGNQEQPETKGKVKMLSHENTPQNGLPVRNFGTHVVPKPPRQRKTPASYLHNLLEHIDLNGRGEKI